MELSNNPQLQEAAALIRAGDRDEAKRLLAIFLKAHPHSEDGWHLLSYALEDGEQKIYVLNRILQINPDNTHVQARLKQLSPDAPNPLVVPLAAPPSPQAPIQATSGAAEKRSLLQSVSQSVGVPTTRQIQAHPTATKSLAATVSMRSTQRKYHIGHRLQTRLTISWRRTVLNWRIFSQSKLAVLGLLLIVVFGLMAMTFPILIHSVWTRSVYDPITGFDLKISPHPSLPGPGHVLGTDSLGRDVLSMILAATTPTFVVGLTAALSTAILGTLLSVTAAYFRGAIDLLITNLADVFLLFPAPVIMVIIGARYRDLTPMQLGLIYGFVTGMGGTTIVMRAQAIQVVSKPFMEAAQIAGGSAWHIITKHLIPSVLPLAALQMMLAVTGAVVADGFISFFGLTRSSSNWGTIIYNAFVYGNISGSYGPPWHMLIPAAACFSLFAMGFYLVSRGLHRIASPIIREEY